MQNYAAVILTKSSKYLLVKHTVDLRKTKESIVQKPVSELAQSVQVSCSPTRSITEGVPQTCFALARANVIKAFRKGFVNVERC